MGIYGRFLIVISACVMLVGCGQEETVTEVKVRPIKTFTINNMANGMVNRYAGIVEAMDTSGLSFQVGGNVQEINFLAGERVNVGDVLAVLDKKPIELSVEAAQAEYDNAVADLNAKEQEFNRQKTLFEKKWISQAAIDQVEVALVSARGNLNFARSRLQLQQRDLDDTVLRSPLSGTLASKDIDVFQQVSAGQQIFEISADGALTIVFSVPETTVSELSVGQNMTASFSAQEGVYNGIVTQIASVATGSTSFEIKASMLDLPDEVRPGMSAEAMIVSPLRNGRAGYLIPLSALIPGEMVEGDVFVFKYEPETSQVVKTRVSGDGIDDNNMFIATAGLDNDDIIAAAGVTFMYDGQQVRLLEN